MKYIYLILLAVLFVGCEKYANRVQYRATITFDDSEGSVSWNDNTRNYPAVIKTSPKTISIFLDNTDELIGNVKYDSGSQKPITVSITLDGQTVADQTGDGVVDIRYLP